MDGGKTRMSFVWGSVAPRQWWLLTLLVACGETSRDPRTHAANAAGVTSTGGPTSTVGSGITSGGGANTSNTQAAASMSASSASNTGGSGGSGSFGFGGAPCYPVTGYPLDEARQCLGEPEGLGCNEGCDAAPSFQRDADGRCWWLSGICELEHQGLFVDASCGNAELEFQACTGSAGAPGSAGSAGSPGSAGAGGETSFGVRRKF